MFGPKEAPPPIPGMGIEKEREFTLENVEKRTRFVIYLDDGSKIISPINEAATGEQEAKMIEGALKSGPRYTDDEGNMVIVPAFRVKKIVRVEADPKSAQFAKEKRDPKYSSIFVPSLKEGSETVN